MTDRELLGYVEIHSETPRALFRAAQLRRLFALADEDFPEPDLHPNAFRALSSYGARPLVERARRRLACPRYEACAAGRARTEALCPGGDRA